MPRSIADCVKQMLTLDLRAVAVLRIGLGAAVCGDLVGRVPDLSAHYTDAGILPRQALIDVFPTFAEFSPYMAAGGVWGVGLLFAVSAVLALGLLVGYRTRLCAIASWILLISLQARNPLVIHGGDMYLRVMLFWALFLPMDARYSVDRLRQGSPWRDSNEHRSLAGFAIFLQIVCVYVFAGLSKTAPDWHATGTAVQRALELDHLTTPLGRWIGTLPPPLLVLVTKTVVPIETLGPLLFFVPLRLAAIVAFIAMHLGFAATLQIGIFPYVCCIGLLVLLPAAVFDRIEGRNRYTTFRPSSTMPPSSKLTLFGAGLKHVVLAAAIAVALIWNLNSVLDQKIDMPVSVIREVDRLHLDQGWGLFAPHPMNSDGWYVMPGKTADGRSVDAFTGHEPTWRRPDDVASIFVNARWRKYLMDIWTDRYAPEHARFGAYLCRRWSDVYPDSSPLARFEIVFMMQITDAAARKSLPKPLKVWEQVCPAARGVRAQSSVPGTQPG